MSESQRIEHELEHWKRWQDKADAIWGWQTPAGQYRAARRARLFVELGHMTRDSIVIEIGCGTGEFTHRIAPLVKELWATDLSPDLLERARKRLAATAPSATVAFEVQDAMALTLPAAKFDAAFGCSVLHHLNPERALNGLWRALKPGGWCVFSEPNMMNPQIAMQKNIPAIKRKVGDSPDETAFFRSEMRQLYEQAGFTKVLVRHFDFLHPLTPQGLLNAVDGVGRFFENIPLVRAVSGSLIACGQKPN